MLAIAHSPNTSDWFSFLPTLFRKLPFEAEEPLDLSDEEIDSDEATRLMLGVPSELINSNSRVTLPPKAVISVKPKPNSRPQFNTKSIQPKILNINLPLLISSKEIRCSSMLSPGQSPPLKKSFPVPQDISSKILELSFKKLRVTHRKQKRPLHQTLVIHRTITLVKCIKNSIALVLPPKPTIFTSHSSPSNVAKPQPVLCRESTSVPVKSNCRSKRNLDYFQPSPVKVW